MPEVMSRKALTRIGGGQKFSAFVDLQFRPEVVKASGSSPLTGLWGCVNYVSYIHYYVIAICGK
jgi:hypothetical protein